MSNSLDPCETPSYSAFHPDPSCLHMALQLYLEGSGFKADHLLKMLKKISSIGTNLTDFICNPREPVWKKSEVDLICLQKINRVMSFLKLKLQPREFFGSSDYIINVL